MYSSKFVRLFHRQSFMLYGNFITLIALYVNEFDDIYISYVCRWLMYKLEFFLFHSCSCLFWLGYCTSMCSSVVSSAFYHLMTSLIIICRFHFLSSLTKDWWWHSNFKDRFSKQDSIHAITITYAVASCCMQMGNC